MASKRFTITMTDEVLAMLDHAKQRWPGLSDNRSALIAQAISRWYWLSTEGKGDENGKHVEEHKLIREQLEDLSQRVAALEAENIVLRGDL